MPTSSRAGLAQFQWYQLPGIIGRVIQFVAGNCPPAFSQGLAECRVELSERYGSQPDIKIVSKRRSGNRLRLKVAVTLPPRDDGLERSEFATCLVTRSKKPASP